MNTVLGIVYWLSIWSLDKDSCYLLIMSTVKSCARQKHPNYDQRSFWYSTSLCDILAANIHNYHLLNHNFNLKYSIISALSWSLLTTLCIIMLTLTIIIEIISIPKTFCENNMLAGQPCDLSPAQCHPTMVAKCNHHYHHCNHQWTISEIKF